jgi:uncharacterized membrane protein
VLKNIFEFIGRFHPLLVHLPIGILIIGLLFHWLAAKDKYAYLKPAVPFLLLAGSITAIFSCITGYVLSLNGDYESSSVAHVVRNCSCCHFFPVLPAIQHAKKNMGA